VGGTEIPEAMMRGGDQRAKYCGICYAGAAFENRGAADGPANEALGLIDYVIYLLLS
jgi:hypothetical protein